ncbi:MAG: DUF302 domain-containing protein [Chitinophagaceae bacterium]
MKLAIIQKTYSLPFYEVYQKLKENIITEGFLLLHEIDTQKIVASHSIEISKLKQILFFHPRYIQQIVTQDDLAINEIPIKIVLYEMPDKQIRISCPNPILRLHNYVLDKNIAEELLKIINKVITI